MKKFAAALVLAAICVAPTGAFAGGKHYGPAPCAPRCAPVCAPACAPACEPACFNPFGLVGGVVSGVGGLISGIGCGISSIFSCGY